ncbi:MAG: hypothetical protein HC818_06515 [Synechococcaceae cyanobacterium RM1_1_27]|nr:hypothetical protein [Synechococcaceae cyanobacterium SM2_3_2]NJO86229.1 hypothetical protein [Synechococcaceae cyanobacterium RM1_1_27]
MAITSVSQTIASIVRDILESARLTEQQEQQINEMLWRRQFSVEDFDALDRLVDALFQHQVEVMFPIQDQFYAA